MWWLLNNTNANDKIKTNTSINFYQIFVNSKIIYNQDNNTIYSFKSGDGELNLNIQLDQIECYNIDYTIKIIDQLISYTNINTGETNVFSFKMNFIKPNINKYKLPIFNFTYKNTNNNRMPNIIESEYDVYTNVNFKIYNIDNNIQFIIEKNLKSNVIKKYWIVEDLDSLKNILK